MADFSEFWQAYPRKVAKRHAYAMWLRLSAEQRAKAVEVIGLHVEYWQAAGRTHETIPHPGSWLNGWRFDDELEMPAPASDVPEKWWLSESGTQAKAAELGVPARAGEGYDQWRGRIREAMRARQ